MSDLLRVVGNQLHAPDGKLYRCAIGKNGFTQDKKEGDGCTPLGVFALRECWFRADHVARPFTHLPLRTIQDSDGWSDDPASPDYNRHILRPYAFSHERLWRDDHLYDVVIPMGYNDNPVISGKGSAIFMHIAKSDYEGTEGCVALALADMLSLLPNLSTESHIDIRAV